NPKVKSADKLRLTLLYLLRYESYNEARELKMLLQDRGVSGQQLALLDAVVAYAGESQRAQGLFAGGGIMSKISKSMASAVSGAQNVYTQHQPVLFHTLDALAKGRIKDATFPPLIPGGGAPTARPSEVVVFMVGGATYEEATKVAEFNAA
ncbi:Sec1-like protein, partial [Ochromonadaceae sp. CCMP2298]